ncbi:MAG: cupin domain-containing protein [Rhodospirillales bacterium]
MKYFFDMENMDFVDLPSRHTTARPKKVDGERVTVAIIHKALGSGSQPHRHPNVEQFNYVLKGKLRAMVEDEKMEVGPGSLIYIPANALHQTVAIGEEDCIYFMAKDAASDKKLGIFGIPEEKGATKPHYDPGFEPKE